jgi:hypothetical protein
MTRLTRILASLATAILLSVGLALPARAAAPPPPICYGGPGPVLGDFTYKGVQVHGVAPCQWLDAGRTWYFPGRRARLTMQYDGNLVIYDQYNRPRWATGTNGSGATQMVFQQDRNLVLYTSGYKRAAWASGTYLGCGSWASMLALQSDNNLVIYCWLHSDHSDMYPIWATGRF